MTPGVAIFVKTPGLSPVKTRLAAEIGAQLAQQWYAMAARAVASVAALVTRQCYWAVAESLPLAAPHWPEQQCIEQGDGDLAARMAFVHANLLQRHGAGVLLGADLPHLQATELQNAFAWLTHKSARQIIGPALDGGFWVYGANRAVALEQWQSVPYSQSDTYQRFLAMSASIGERYILSMQSDVDRASDLSECLAHLRLLHAPTVEQQELANWMQANRLGLP